MFPSQMNVHRFLYVLYVCCMCVCACICVGESVHVCLNVCVLRVGVVEIVQYRITNYSQQYLDINKYLLITLVS